MTMYCKQMGFIRRRCSSGFFKPNNNVMLPTSTYKDKTVLITGGGTGLGKAMALQYAKLGAQVVITSRRLDILDETAKEIMEITNQRVLALKSDVRVPGDVEDMVNNMISQIGLPDVVINNAAGNFITPFEKLSSNGFKTIIDIVLNGTANITLDIGKRLIKENRSGVFLSISTTYASTGSGFVVASACAKAGVEAMIKSLAAEWGKYGLRFVGIAPGPIETKGANDRLDPTGSFRQKVLQNIPAGRLGTYEELSNLATFLTSDYAAWINGEIVVLDGGETVMNAGEFNSLISVTPSQWKNMESLVREKTQK